MSPRKCIPAEYMRSTDSLCLNGASMITWIWERLGISRGMLVLEGLAEGLLRLRRTLVRFLLILESKASLLLGCV